MYAIAEKIYQETPHIGMPDAILNSINVSLLLQADAQVLHSYLTKKIKNKIRVIQLLLQPQYEMTQQSMWQSPYELLHVNL